jgi:glycosyltransferase involved in cell wall biosynthesis
MHIRVCIENTALRLFYRLWTSLFADRVVCISEAVRRHYWPDNLRATTVYNPGPDLSLFNPSKTFDLPQGIRTDRLGVLAIGKFVQVKGHSNFVRMAALVNKKIPGQAHFYILGGKVLHHERYWDAVMNEIDKAGIKDSLTILAPVANSQVPAVISKMAVFVHIPCWQEGLGGVVLEAMAMAKPVVAFDSGGVGECFSNGKSGFLVPHMEISAAAEKVAELLIDVNMRNLMGDSARQELQERFSFKKHFSAIDEIYRHL